MAKLSIFKTLFNKKNGKIVKKDQLVTKGQVLFWVVNGMTDEEWIRQTKAQLCEYDYLMLQLKKIRPEITDETYDRSKLKLYKRLCIKNEE
jgi:hypothetical protein